MLLALWGILLAVIEVKLAYLNSMIIRLGRNHPLNVKARACLDCKMACQVEVYPNLMSGRAALNVRIEFVLLFIDTFRQR